MTRPPAPALSPAEAAFVARPAVDIAADEREEAAARAIAEAEGWTTWPPSDHFTREQYRRLARAALAAVRPPADDPAAAVERPRLREQMQLARKNAWDDGYDACRRGEQRHNPYRSPR